jgi:hypothetical protein
MIQFELLLNSFAKANKDELNYLKGAIEQMIIARELEKEE